MISDQTFACDELIVITIFAELIREDVESAPMKIHMDSIPLHVSIAAQVFAFVPLVIMPPRGDISDWCTIKLELVIVWSFASFRGVESECAHGVLTIICAKHPLLSKFWVSAIK